MGLTYADLSGKSSMMPGTESVTYFAAEGGADLFSPGFRVNECERRNISWEERNSSGIMLNQEAEIWHLWAAKLSGKTPKTGDKFTDKYGKSWHVNSSTSELLGARYRLICTRGDSE